ncbi:DNA (cytosine-5-)-methyltransferase [Pseudolactococcus reticulitermitis]|uniref:Cytosine-specific methyltransferase n=1 Tax=Pseudolactococcus reticulitermitis TaxID=2025039 RepID=A0A224WWQ6_9LACT|nr:DNA (cytosine-5-)-methyltransferase [Lactococcus reticulitermitis]GAX46707.1 hypothetical protein RsY01_286 [Lactococcus reticulitermitis]
MLRVIEAFSGIGAQKQALLDSGIEHEIINTIEWDINAIYAYDKMHNGDKEPSKYSKPKILEKLSNLTLSSDGKNPMKEKTLSRMNEEKLQRLYGAIERNRNLCDITKVKGKDIPDDIDLLTYSFPCQDLSQASTFQNKDSKGIEKGAGTRSGLLWEVERILQEKFDEKEILPKFLLMENVNAINSPKHNDNFKTWQTELNKMGYENRVYERLNAIDFGVPQKRSRTFMLSVRIDKFSHEEVASKIPDKFKSTKEKNLAKFLRLGKFPEEEKLAEPNFTPSRQRIATENLQLVVNGQISEEFTNTITTKQDRNPNAGVIVDKDPQGNVTKMRYLTSRETFLLMGFPEIKFENLILANKRDKYFSNTHLYKMAGNSIVVDVLIEIFKEIIRLKKELFDGE